MRILFFLLFFSTLFAKVPEVIVFDFGGVVGSVDRKPMLIFLSESLHVPYAKVKEDFAKEKIYQSFEKSRDFWEKYAKKTALSEEWFEQFKQMQKAIVCIFPGMKDILEGLKQQGFQIVLLSNTSHERACFIQRMGGYSFFNPIILSCDLGVNKPHPRIYKTLFQLLKQSPKNCLFIDNKKTNIDAGKKFGMDGIVFESPLQLVEELKNRGIQLEPPKISLSGTHLSR